LGTPAPPPQALKGKYPEVFEAYAKQEKKALELKAFIHAKLGFDFTQMSISDYIRLTEGLIEMKMKK